MYKKGDLVYIPSETMMYDNELKTTAYEITDKPWCCLVLEDKNNHLLVERRGLQWLVRKREVHRIGEESASQIKRSL